MIDDLKKGDEVVTGGGIIATVKAVKDDELTVEIAKGVDVKVQKATLMNKIENNAH